MNPGNRTGSVPDCHVRRARNLLATFALLGAFVLAAPGVAHGGQTTTITFDVNMTSNQTVLEQVGRGGDTTYGWNLLTGEAATDSGDVSVTLLGNVQYVDGSGPFFGFLTLKFASQSTLGLRIQGTAAKQADGSTSLKSKLKVIDGTAAMTGARGGGSFTGSRDAPVGSPIEITVKLKIKLS
jgi:hypothetical protein